LEANKQVTRLVVLNTWMWSFAGDAGVKRAAAIVGGPFGRFLYRRANFSIRVIMPAAFADRKKLTREMHAQYMSPFSDAWSREAVLWTLARSLLGSSPHYEGLWRRRNALADIPSLIVWGMKDPAFRPHHLSRWRDVLPSAEVLELPVGHWPQEEMPEAVAAAVARFMHRP
jgi:haloalkane dehalogenase